MKKNTLHHLIYNVSQFEITQKNDFLKNSEICCDKELVLELYEMICEMGFIEPITNNYQMPIPNKNQDPNQDFRENIMGVQSISRTRMTMYLIEKYLKNNNSKVFLPESITPFAHWVKKRLPAEIYASEYKRNDSVDISGESSAGIRIEDLQDLSYKDNFFDIAIVNEILEHVAKVEQAISELFRVIKKGGTLLATFPLDLNSDETIILAEELNNEITHYAEPTYHRDPLDTSKGTLCYRVFGWDILKMCKDHGFNHASYIFLSSLKHGILGSDMTHCVTLKAVK